MKKPWSLARIALVYVGLGLGAATVGAGTGSPVMLDSTTGLTHPYQISACYMSMSDGTTVDTCTGAPPTAVGQALRVTSMSTNPPTVGFVVDPTDPRYVYFAGSGTQDPSVSPGVTGPVMAVFYQTIHAVDAGAQPYSLWWKSGDCMTCWTQFGAGGGGGGSSAIALISPLGTITIGASGAETTIDVTQLANANPGDVLTGIIGTRTGISTSTATGSHSVTQTGTITTTGTGTQTITQTGTATATATYTLTGTGTATVTQTATATNSSGATITVTQTATATQTQTQTATHTVTTSATGTATATATRTLTQTGTTTGTSTYSTTGTDTHAVTGTGTATDTNGTQTQTATATSTSSAVDLVTGESSPIGVATNTTYIYWADNGNGKIRRALLNGASVVSLVTGEANPNGIAINATYIYWTDYDNGTIRRATLAGTGTVSLVTGESSPVCVAVDGTYVYWTTNSAIRRATLAGGSKSDLVAGESSPYGIAVDGTYVYWANNGNGKLRRAALNGSGAMDLVSAETNIWGIAVSTAYSYWSISTGNIRRATIAGADSENIITGETTPYGIAVDGTYVYWTAPGKIRRALLSTTTTYTQTATATRTITQTATSTATESITQSQTQTSTGTVTQTATGTFTQTQTQTASGTATGSESYTLTGTGTVTATGTVTQTTTATGTVTNTNGTTTATSTGTGTHSVTTTATGTGTATDTQTLTGTATGTASASNTTTVSGVATGTDIAFTPPSGKVRASLGSALDYLGAVCESTNSSILVSTTTDSHVDFKTNFGPGATQSCSGATCASKAQGSGTLNYVPKWTPSGTQLGNSSLLDGALSVDINKTVRVTGSTTIVSGAGMEMEYSAGGVLGAYNYDTATQMPMSYYGSAHHFWAGSSERMTVDTSGINASNISATPTASYIPKANTSHKLDPGWLPAGSTSVAGALQLESANPVASTYGGTAAPGASGKASDSAHKHALAPLPTASTSAAGICQLGTGADQCMAGNTVLDDHKVKVYSGGQAQYLFDALGSDYGTIGISLNTSGDNVQLDARAATTSVTGIVRLDPNNPQPDGVAAPGSSGRASDGAHVHPIALAEGSFLGWNYYTTAGTSTPTLNAKTTLIFWRMRGGGGGGGGAYSAYSGYPAAGGGGAQGSYVEGYCTVFTSLSYTVGVGGVGGSSATSELGGTGGYSSIHCDNGTNYAYGGIGGNGMVADQSKTLYFSAGGAGQVWSSAYNTWQGSPGAFGMAMNDGESGSAASGAGGGEGAGVGVVAGNGANSANGNGAGGGGARVDGIASRTAGAGATGWVAIAQWVSPF